MAYILTNGKAYIYRTDTGAVKITTNPCEAEYFAEADMCRALKIKASKKTKGYAIYDTETGLTVAAAPNQHVKIPPLIRQYVYKQAAGKCVLCGRSISKEEFTIDHIIPLSMGGENNIDNFQCTCYACNQFKKNILPEDFIKRISDIFLYQTEKQCKSKLKWKLFNKVLQMIYKAVQQPPLY